MSVVLLFVVIAGADRFAPSEGAKYDGNRLADNKVKSDKACDTTEKAKYCTPT
ncbi:hypothetical protein KC957_04560 [Candidatus Saccharibacteria bacterium]|nr:hypothetical protein [Candidatus Saccharibacteria bacterium]